MIQDLFLLSQKKKRKKEKQNCRASGKETDLLGRPNRSDKKKAKPIHGDMTGRIYGGRMWLQLHDFAVSVGWFLSLFAFVVMGKTLLSMQSINNLF